MDHPGTPRHIRQIDWPTWQPTEKATLLFVLMDGRILLIDKKTGLGAGKIDGPGGRIDPGETALHGAIREVQEELCVTPTGVHRARGAFLPVCRRVLASRDGFHCHGLRRGTVRNARGRAPMDAPGQHSLPADVGRRCAVASPAPPRPAIPRLFHLRRRPDARFPRGEARAVPSGPIGPVSPCWRHCYTVHMGPRRFLLLTGIATTLLLAAASFLTAQSPVVVHCDVLVGFNGTVREGRFAAVRPERQEHRSRLSAEIAIRVTWGGVRRDVPGRTITQEAVLITARRVVFPFSFPFPATCAPFGRR